MVLDRLTIRGVDATNPVASSRLRIAQSPPSRLSRDGGTSAETMHTILSHCHLPGPFPPLCRCWTLFVPTESGRNLSASGVTCPPLADRLTYNHIGANKSIFYGLAFLRYCHNIPEIIFQSKLLVGFRHKWRDR